MDRIDGLFMLLKFASLMCLEMVANKGYNIGHQLNF